MGGWGLGEGYGGVLGVQRQRIWLSSGRDRGGGRGRGRGAGVRGPETGLAGGTTLLKNLVDFWSGYRGWVGGVGGGSGVQRLGWLVGGLPKRAGADMS